MRVLDNPLIRTAQQAAEIIAPTHNIRVTNRPRFNLDACVTCGAAVSYASLHCDDCAADWSQLASR